MACASLLKERTTQQIENQLEKARTEFITYIKPEFDGTDGHVYTVGISGLPDEPEHGFFRDNMQIPRYITSDLFWYSY